MSSPNKKLAFNREPPGPVAPALRMVEVDMVRGFALFGVLLVNMYGFGADSIAWNSPTDELAFAIMRIFFESKMWTLFSILFGFGFALQMQSANARSFSLLPTYLRRLTALFIFGAAHALFFDGDILMLYAELGLVLLVIRGLSTRKLLLLTVGLILIFPLARFISDQDPTAESEDIMNVSEARSELKLSQNTDVYATGSFVEIAADNASAIPADPLEDLYTPESGLTVLGMFILGFVLGRSNILRNIPGHVLCIARIRFWGLGLGLAAMAGERVLAATYGYAIFREQQAETDIQLAGDLLFTFGASVLALGYAATLILAAQTPRGKAVLMPLAAVGRLALTVYLTQTLMFTTLFYGYGFGQVFRLGPATVTAWAVVIFAMQIVVCQWWLKYFRFGPVEWLWRSLTYLKWQPLRVKE